MPFQTAPGRVLTVGMNVDHHNDDDDHDDETARRLAEAVREARATSPRDALAGVAVLRGLVRRLEDAATDRAVVTGMTYAEIGRLLGMTRQSVRVKHLARLAHGDRSQATAYWNSVETARRRWEERQRERAELHRWWDDLPAAAEAATEDASEDDADPNPYAPT